MERQAEKRHFGFLFRHLSPSLLLFCLKKEQTEQWRWELWPYPRCLPCPRRETFSQWFSFWGVFPPLKDRGEERGSKWTPCLFSHLLLILCLLTWVVCQENQVTRQPHWSVSYSEHRGTGSRHGSSPGRQDTAGPWGWAQGIRGGPAHRPGCPAGSPAHGQAPAARQPGPGQGAQARAVGQSLTGPRACSCHVRPKRWQSQPGLLLHRAPAREPLPSEILQTWQSRHLRFSFHWTSCCLSGFGPFSEPDIALCSMSGIWNRRKQLELWLKPRPLLSDVTRSHTEVLRLS